MYLAKCASAIPPGLNILATIDLDVIRDDWATEKCYLLAWSCAKDQAREVSEEIKSKDVMLNTFIPNWSSPEFEKFMDALEGLLDELAKM